ncbi:MAG: phosphoglycerate dehydrogenase [Oscillospiraceae bacterium]
MYKIKTINNISDACRTVLDEREYVLGDDFTDPDVIFVRASSLLDYDFNDNLLCIARAGIGVNTIPIEKLANKGVVVFNTPGGNANGVKEIFLMAMGMACRDIMGAMQWVLNFDTSKGDISVVMEKVKKQFVGPEYIGKKLGVVGMGNVGRRVANIAQHLGMDVFGYDPYLSVDAAWLISNKVVRVSTLDQLRDCDFITLHTPLTDETRDMINKDFLNKLRDGVRIINYSRQEVVNEPDMIDALNSGKVARFVTDFPTNTLIGTKNVVMTPHLGGTTYESEENCAMMAAREAVDYIEYGNIVNSVNFGRAVMPASKSPRICIFHKNIPNMIAHITSAISARGINIENMVNSSLKGSPVAYTMLELSTEPDEALCDAIKANEGTIRVRVIPEKK